MSRINVSLRPRQYISLANQRQTLVFAPERLAPGVAAQLRDMGLRLVAAGAPQQRDQAVFADTLPVQPDHIDGWLGHFRATLMVRGHEEDLGVLSARKDNFWDWIIDAGALRWFSSEVAPPGYVHLPEGRLDEAAEAALRPVSEDQVRLPQAIDMRPDRCVHHSRGHEGCTLCLEGCPAGAILSQQGAIRVQAELCHGCGLCAARCPTGAIRYAYPSAGGVLAAALEALHEAGAAKCLTVRISNAELPECADTVDLVLPSVAAFGAQLWLSLLAMGWARVVLVTGHLPASSREVLDATLPHWNSMLDTPRLIATPDAESVDGPAPASTVMALPAQYRTWPTDKRRLISHALARLIPETDEFVSLPSGFPLGKVSIDADRCSQCMACAQLCPTDALAETEEGDALTFTQTQCAQCGICVSGCPESAIRLEPGLEMNSQARDTAVTLFEVHMAQCVQCGAPIMASGVLESVRGRLGPDTTVNLEVLNLCQACRVNQVFGFSAGDTEG